MSVNVTGTNNNNLISLLTPAERFYNSFHGDVSKDITQVLRLSIDNLRSSFAEAGPDIIADVTSSCELVYDDVIEEANRVLKASLLAEGSRAASNSTLNTTHIGPASSSSSVAGGSRPPLPSAGNSSTTITLGAINVGGVGGGAGGTGSGQISRRSTREIPSRRSTKEMEGHTRSFVQVTPSGSIILDEDLFHKRVNFLASYALEKDLRMISMFSRWLRQCLYDDVCRHMHEVARQDLVFFNSPRYAYIQYFTYSTRII